MKNTKRAERRAKKLAKFKRRVSVWINWGHVSTRFDSPSEFKEQILKGKACTFLRTTLNPCNCYMCSGSNKYIRDRKYKLFKDSDEDRN